MAKRITLKDVAKNAGVTPATVSMVINEKDNISEPTKDKVWKVIKELGYYPNAVARGLATSKTNTIAVVIPDLSASFAIEVMQGIKRKIDEHHEKMPYSIVLLDMMGFHGVKNISEMFKSIIGEGRVDGLIIIGQDATGADFEILNKANMPFVVVSKNVKEADCVYGDDYLGAFIATEYLINKNYKKIALITHKKQEDRTKGFIGALAKNGIDIRDDAVLFSRSMDIYAGKEMGEKIVENISKYDALFVAANDLVALGVMKVIQKSGLIIPDDIAIIGYDDIPAAEIVTPSLTTVRQPMVEMGEEAILLMVEKIKRKSDRVEVVVYPRLIERESA